MHAHNLHKQTQPSQYKMDNFSAKVALTLVLLVLTAGGGDMMNGVEGRLLFEQSCKCGLPACNCDIGLCVCNGVHHTLVDGRLVPTHELHN
ncbi:hypothetical protein LINPERPRIM_LOCUS8429 [Linum perenne]